MAGIRRLTKARDKLLGRAAARRLVDRARARGQRVVFTSGCYDLLHVGHVRGFEQAAQLGDLLIVGVNRDARVRELKGADRPLVPERQRAEVIAALACVDAVVLFPEETAGPLIRALRPDVVGKGAEYRGQRTAEQEAVESIGGRFALLRQTPNIRTSLLIRKAKR